MYFNLIGKHFSEEVPTDFTELLNGLTMQMHSHTLLHTHPRNGRSLLWGAASHV